MGNGKSDLARVRKKLAERKVSGVCRIARRRDEFFRIRQFRRVYDRESGKFTFNISYETHTNPTPRSLVVAEAFGLGIDEAQRFKVLDAELNIGPRDIVYITGDSGSGKSVLLRAIKQDLGEEAIDLSEVAVDADKPLIETVGATVEEGLELLSKVGLNDAFLFLRTYNQLSDGQKYRYRIAKLIESGRQWWLMDEFAACLDRDTAKIIAFNLQKIARQQGKAVLAATTHTDLAEDLNPSVHIHKRFGKEITVNYYPNVPAKECSLIKEMRVTEGTTEDWKKLASFHYRSHKIAGLRKIFCLKRGEELCGVIVYCYPPPTCFGRRLVLPKMGMKELNQKLSIISRVVVHPKYRTIGLGSKLVKETLPLAGTENVEMPAVMAKYNPFAEKAGMKKVAEQPPPKEALRIAEVLEYFGFNIQLLGSEKYVLNKLQALSGEDLEKVREAFSKHCHTRFMKYLFPHQVFGRKKDYVEALKTAGVEKLAHLIRLCGFLLQTKVYLFWSAS
ncbi:GNAT family N-acetyltransferase [Candidatus Bathyarchaeota archaeon A05DMB-2]|jgi:ABC-type ATPase with predicted acetyltransferase domain|nr:GNAT family N-acetyltransferase [Candidatus Bathyarchaeota archaeon A05DMB-2]